MLTLRVAGEGRMPVWPSGKFMFVVLETFDGQPAAAGNGTMAGLSHNSVEQLNRLNAKAIESGGAAEGGPGVRFARYSACFMDLDGNKVCSYE